MNNIIKKLTFFNLSKNRLNFLKSNSEIDHKILRGNNNVLLSCPHAVSQVRLGKLKFMEIGSCSLALALQKLTNSHLIVKTKNNNDDANFDLISEYKNDIGKIIEENNIKYLVDFHGLSHKRNVDVNLGVNFGRNIQADTSAFDRLMALLGNAKFNVSIDQPFSGGKNTIAGTVNSNYPDCFSIQVEINSKFTNRPENFDKMQKLIEIFYDWILSLGK